MDIVLEERFSKKLLQFKIIRARLGGADSNELVIRYEQRN